MCNLAFWLVYFCLFIASKLLPFLNEKWHKGDTSHDLLNFKKKRIPINYPGKMGSWPPATYFPTFHHYIIKIELYVLDLNISERIWAKNFCCDKCNYESKPFLSGAHFLKVFKATLQWKYIHSRMCVLMSEYIPTSKFRYCCLDL